MTIFFQNSHFTSCLYQTFWHLITLCLTSFTICFPSFGLVPQPDYDEWSLGGHTVPIPPTHSTKHTGIRRNLRLLLKSIYTEPFEIPGKTTHTEEGVIKPI